MKSVYILIAILFLVINYGTAQVIQKPVTKKNMRPATTTTKTETPQSAPALVYRLTGVKVSIKTGNDNKEYPSIVQTGLSVRNSGMQYAFFRQDNLKNEMKSNSTTEFWMEKMGLNLKEITLDEIQKRGLQLTINYNANFQFDAWKIEGISVLLEIRDQFDNPHPTLFQKVITFGNANGFLNGYPGTTYMMCETDGYLNPLSAYIK